MKTVRSERLHIIFVGICNAGKSSLMNALAGRSLAIVADEPGTTTDPVEKSMEFGDLGPVVLVDTAGLDDPTPLGKLREQRTLDVVSRGDIFILVTPANKAPLDTEKEIFTRLVATNKTMLVVGTFADSGIDREKNLWLQSLATQHANIIGNSGSQQSLKVCFTSAATGLGIQDAKTALISLNTVAVRERTPLEGLVERGDALILVTPIDSAAPKGRLILPEAEVLRDALDRGCVACVVQPNELKACYSLLATPPRLVVTDSQAFTAVAHALPSGQALTSFSILYARKKGELSWFARGIEMLDKLSGNKSIELLAIEACTHNRTHEDIATVKLPALLSAKTGAQVRVTPVRSLRDIPPERMYDLAVICGSCMATRSAFTAQMRALESVGIPVVNFGIMLAWGAGLLSRALKPLSDTGDPVTINSHLCRSAMTVPQ